MFPDSVLLACSHVYAGVPCQTRTLSRLEPCLVMHLLTAVDAPHNIMISVYVPVMNQDYMLGRLNSSTPCIICKICNSPEPHVDDNPIETK